MDKITANAENPNPNTLHALSSLLENEESSNGAVSGENSQPESSAAPAGRATGSGYRGCRRGTEGRRREVRDEEESNENENEALIFKAPSINGQDHRQTPRTLTPILSTPLSSLLENEEVQENDEFFELLSSKFLSERRYSISVQAAATRLLFSCSLTFMYPHVFEETVLENLKTWVMEETARSGDDHYWRHESGEGKSTDSEMLKTYSTGLLAVCLASGGQVVEDVLTPGLPAKLMRYLRIRILGETNITQRDLVESKTASTSVRTREEGRGSRHTHGEEHWIDEEPPDRMPADVNSYDAETEGEEKWHIRDLREGKTKHSGRSVREEEVDESAREDSARRRTSRGWARSRVRGRVTEGVMENEQTLTSPNSGNRLGGQSRSRNLTRNYDGRRIPDSKKSSGRNSADGFGMERDENDDCFQECKVGSKDITDLEFEKANDEEAAILAASRAASTVVDAAIAVEVARSVKSANESQESKLTEKNGEDFDEFFILDSFALAKLREKFCIQCLAILGEYVEVLGPVLHEKGVDVCLALLQRNSKDKEGMKVSLLLPDVLKLIWSLAAHRKFAAVFVDRGGMQKLLAVPKVPPTFFGLSSCLFTIGSIQDGLQKMLNLLHDAASVRAGSSSGALTASGSLRSERSPPEVLTSSEKQIAYHTCVALRQYFRAHLLLIVDSIRPNKNVRSAARNVPSVRAAYKPLDISNEAMDAVFRQIQKDRKLGSALVRARWNVVDKFFKFKWAYITMLELCQAAPPVERYLHDLLQYALGVLHIVTLVPNSRKLIVNATLSNDRLAVAVILDAANGAGYVEPEVSKVLHSFLQMVLILRTVTELQSELFCLQMLTTRVNPRERNGESALVDRGSSAVVGSTQGPHSAVPSGLVGDRRISLGTGAGCAGLAAQLEQCYHQAREAVRANNGIKVGKKLSELIRDSGNQTPGTEQNKWQAELAQVAIELIGVVTSSGRASTLAATDAATPTLRRIERAAIAAATPISYHARELLLLIHEHLQASGLGETASTLLKEAQLTPLPSLAMPSSLTYQISGQETTSLQTQWPSGRAPVSSAKRKPLTFSSEIFSTPIASVEVQSASAAKLASDTDVQFKTPILLPMKRKLTDIRDSVSGVPPVKRLNTGDNPLRSPTLATPNPARRCGVPSDANLLLTPSSSFKDHHGRSLGSALPADGDDNQSSNSLLSQMSSSQHNLLNDMQASNAERLTLDSLVVQYLKHQHRQCPAPITTLPPLSLLQPHVCPEPRRSLDAPSNVTARLTSREFRSMYGGIHGRRKDRQFVYSRFRPWRTCRDDTGALLTCMTFLGDSSQIAAGSHLGELKIFDSNSNTIVESFTSHQNPLTQLQSYLSGDTQLILSSSVQDVQLWDASSVSAGPRHSFEGCKAPRFSKSGTTFAALSTETQREILLYDIQTCQLELKLTDASNIISAHQTICYFWNGVLWDHRGSRAIHRFDQFTDYGGGGFHPAGNEVIINSEVWDLRKFRLLRSVPSLDQTIITFNASGDVIYAILRRNVEEVTSAFNTRRTKHSLFSAFRTVDAVNYADIATIPVDRCVLDFATEPTDSFVGLVTMDDQDEMYSSARVYEIGRRRLTEDDSDPDDADSEEDEDDDDDVDEEDIIGTELDGDGESDGDDLSIDDSLSALDDDEEDDDGEFIMDDMDYDGGAGILEIVTEGEDDDSQLLESFGSEDEDDLL
nr:DDB1- and CUL4-associated factor homolog 1 [Ipomoea batatas]